MREKRINKLAHWSDGNPERINLVFARQLAVQDLLLVPESRLERLQESLPTSACGQVRALA